MRRVFLGPVEIAGYYAALQPALEALGYRVLRTDLWEDRRRYALARQPLLARLAIAAGRRAGAARGRRGAALWSKLQGLLLGAFFLRALATCDTFVYAFGGTITWRPALELRLLRRLGRRVVVVFHGSDARPPYLDGQIMASDRGVSIADCAALAAAHKARATMFEAAADAVIVSPTFAHFLERPAVNWHAIGIPSAAPLGAEAPPDMAAPSGDAVRVLHGPSHPESKGTPAIRAAVARVQARGWPIEYVEVIDRPHADVLAELARCDFVIDSAYCDVPMSGFATEAAAFGRPAVVGGPSGEAFAETIAPGDMPPVLYCRPEELEAAITRLAADAAFRRELGARAQAFARANRDPMVVARRFARVLEGDVPAEWLFDPARLRHVGGFGEPALLRRLVRGVVTAYGPSALQLDDKPALRQLVLDFGFDDGPAAADAPAGAAGETPAAVGAAGVR